MGAFGIGTGMCMNASSDGMPSSMDGNMVQVWFVHGRNQDVGKNVAGTACRRAWRTFGMNMDAMRIG